MDYRGFGLWLIGISANLFQIVNLREIKQNLFLCCNKQKNGVTRNYAVNRCVNTPPISRFKGKEYFR